MTQSSKGSIAIVNMILMTIIKIMIVMMTITMILDVVVAAVEIEKYELKEW